MPFTVPPSNKVQGQAGFMPDIDNAYGAISQLAAGNVLSSAYAGGADPSGAADSTAAILSALTQAGIAILPPGGTYSVANLVMPSGSILWAYGSTIVQSASGTTVQMASSCRVLGASFYGGSSTTSSNPAADAIGTASGATTWQVADIRANNVNGWILNPAISGSLHGSVRGVDASACAGGIQLTQGTGTTTVAAEVQMSDVNIQRCTANPALSVMGVTDVYASMLNLSTDGALNTGPTILLQGKCSGGLSGIDAGVVNAPTAATGILTIQDAAASSPSNWSFTGGQVQNGGIGVLVSGGAARLRFTGIMSSGNQGDGWKLTGTGTAILIDGCAGNSNNAAAGTAYDVEVTSTVHVGLMGFTYASTGVTNSLIVGTNNVLNVNSTNPGGKTVSGTPAGW